ncbi:aminotransferase DegT [Mesorhizobium sp. SEMIA 3007]|jgi:dTDP-4-amino-4,6-dideoxygalactose transaminase|uniref:DegT/DnrJ/EryC1/StrS aminotransferase family protein n=1 Tax=Mesorhizobium jarvisii TaxID=1777867 RepID=A0A6M7TF20_9HYPH|nr:MULTISPECIES: DegT/DnrJ/EryC1/StrS aminotransferase family protein [Mesorhizobium]AID28222.2 aminotransferase class I/II-fold pyridoxal phosphate-dependent enzyme [Mesorhizobium huakuii 7653R]MCH4560223.1 DegT/DnrJ/EryC1/StrS aminotransferase family protein [Mesorhizobium jarvisii]OBQ58187.1 aminotransferase DegT [Mesorhizobium loti]ODA93622.1 aminotransferase DegT [Mesorhizobium sp. SEMIA 3007]QKC63302.1 DegT/DnrJ/EryC1/StrS aminotransferase family protein [Mesorhizobium jarvisii]
MLLVSAPILGEPEKAALSKVIDSGWLTMGEQVRAFELAFADMHGARDCVAVGSCTAALHLILHALGIGPGDEVLVPSLTFVATANAVLYVGATPVFVDIESVDVPLMSLAEAEARCTSRTKAVILVHFAGYLANREQWQRFARVRGLHIIEDAAHAPGLREVGTFGTAAAFSFYGNKNMTTAEGGAVIARDSDLLDRVRQARGHGMTSGTHQRLNSRTPQYDVTMLGFNYRMDEMRAAIGLVQLQNLQEWNEIRRILAVLYRRLIAEHCPAVTIPFSEPRTSAHHIMPILLPRYARRQDVIDELRTQGIQTTIHYPPVHQMTFYRERYPDITLPRTEDFAQRELTIPLHPQITSTLAEAVVAALASALNGGAQTGTAA